MIRRRSYRSPEAWRRFPLRLGGKVQRQSGLLDGQRTIGLLDPFLACMYEIAALLSFNASDAYQQRPNHHPRPNPHETRAQARPSPGFDEKASFLKAVPVFAEAEMRSVLGYARGGWERRRANGLRRPWCGGLAPQAK